MRFKTENLEKEFFKLDPKLRMILCNLDYMCIRRFKREIIITSLFREKTTDSGIHADYRGADLRTINYFTKQEIETILEYLNLDYIYDNERPNMRTAIFHDVGQGEHLHIQTMKTII